MTLTTAILATAAIILLWLIAQAAIALRTKLAEPPQRPRLAVAPTHLPTRIEYRDRPPEFWAAHYERLMTERTALATRIGVLEHQVTELRRLAGARGGEVVTAELRALDDAQDIVTMVLADPVPPILGAA